MLEKAHHDKEKVMVSGIDGGMGDLSSIMWQSFLKNADKDGDGKISKDEFMANATQNGNSSTNAADLFSKLDTNGDGFIDETESKAAFTKMHHHGHHHKTDLTQMFQDADKDGNGQISSEEFKAMNLPGISDSNAATLFKNADTNGDNSLSLDEFKTMMSERDSFSALA